MLSVQKCIVELAVELNITTKMPRVLLFIGFNHHTLLLAAGVEGTCVDVPVIIFA